MNETSPKEIMRKALLEHLDKLVKENKPLPPFHVLDVSVDENMTVTAKIQFMKPDPMAALSGMLQREFSVNVTEEK